VHEGTEEGVLSKIGSMVEGIHSIVARCLGATMANGSSDEAASWAAAEPCLLAWLARARDATLVREAIPKGACSMLSEGGALVPASSGARVLSGMSTWRDKHLGLSPAHRFEHAVSFLTSVSVKSHSGKVDWLTCKTARKIISRDGKSTVEALAKIRPS